MCKAHLSIFLKSNSALFHKVAACPKEKSVDIRLDHTTQPNIKCDNVKDKTSWTLTLELKRPKIWAFDCSE